ncbi:MAG: Gfo/Idh/MocA family oxidoreductase [Clostridia bacterium]|nr:Gfo/Idh/MocA family oxidoreductase [Clostridia bacterium]
MHAYKTATDRRVDNRRIRTGIFGLSHPHISTLYGMMKRRPEDFEIVGFADIPPSDALSSQRRLFEGSDSPREYADWRKLAAQSLDLAVVTTDNASRGDVCCELLSRGIHVLDEKPMAMNYADAERMYRCAKENGVRMLTNWPIAWFPTFRLAKQLLDEGRIGKLMRVVYRSPATWGPFSYSNGGILPPEEELKKSWWYQADRGGGSILDYACYGAILSTWMFGHRARRVGCMTKQFTTGFCDVEDYSAMMLDFGDGIGLLEGSWSTFNCGEIPTGPVLYGTDGVIVCDRHSKKVKLYSGISHPPVAPVEVFEPGDIRQEEMLGADIVRSIRDGIDPDEMLGTELNLDVVAALDAGMRSAKTGVIENTMPLADI